MSVCRSEKLEPDIAARGALEPHFFQQLLQGLGLRDEDLPGLQSDRRTWPALAKLFKACFRSKSRDEWVAIFDETDACCTPVLTQDELERAGYAQRPAVYLDKSASYAIAQGNSGGARDGQGEGVDGAGWTGEVMHPGLEGERILQGWTGWKAGTEFEYRNGSVCLSRIITKL